MRNLSRDSEGLLCAVVGDITVTVSIHGDTLVLEQPGDNIEPDLIMVCGKEGGNKLLGLIQEWLNDTTE